MLVSEQVPTSDLTKALSRLAGNRHSDGISSIVSADDRSVIINGCYEMMIALKAPSPRAQALEEEEKVTDAIALAMDALLAARKRLASIDPEWEQGHLFPIAIEALNSPPAAIRSLSSQPVADGWLPIETAEKDVPILIFHHPENQWRGKIHIAYAHSDFNGHKHVITEDGPCGWIIHPKPTHWRPLPTSPGVAV